MRSMVVPGLCFVVAAVTFALQACGGSPEPAPPNVATASVTSSPASASAPSAAPAANASPSAAPVAETCGGRCVGRVGAELVEALGSRAQKAHRCYDNALALDPTVRGKVTVRAKIGADGRVCDVNATSEVPGMNQVATCVSNVFRGKELGPSYPPPEGGCVDVAQPINFVPRSDAGAPTP